MSQVLEEQFGRPPLCFRVPANGYGWGGVLFVTGDEEAVNKQLASDPKLAELMKEWTKTVPEIEPEPATTCTATHGSRDAGRR